MPNQSNDRYRQDPERLWPAIEPGGRFPASAYRGRRGGVGTPPWSGVDQQPAGATSRGGLNTR
ncbi:DNA repair protein [Micromonospora sp. KLBMP9576]|uniref:DNA repair protein n=1 Tax=Micromonospora sp. KLBMP9576 TaxID=3424769 RepID=UPI003D920859